MTADDDRPGGAEVIDGVLVCLHPGERLNDDDRAALRELFAAARAREAARREALGPEGRAAEDARRDAAEERLASLRQRAFRDAARPPGR